MYYGPTIILATGIQIGHYSSDDPEEGILLNIPLALVNAIGSLIAVFFIDKLGRRFIMLRGIPLIFISCSVVSISMYFSLFGSTPTLKDFGNYMAMFGLVLYLAFFSISMSSTPWSVNTEIYPIHLIGIATSLATATNWLSNFIVSFLFLQIMETDAGKVAAFMLLSVFCIFAWFFIYSLLPETNGKSIPENVHNVVHRNI